MALTEYTLPEQVTVSGTIQTTLYCDVAGLTVPTGSRFLSISEIIERPEDAVGVFALSQMTVTVRDDYTTYTEGFWYKVMAEATEVQLKVTRTENGGNEFLFWGYSQRLYVRWEEDVDTGSAYNRRGSFTMTSMLGKLADASLASVITEFLTHAVTAVQPAPTDLAFTPWQVGTETFGYKVRAVYGNGSSALTSEVTDTACDDIGGGNDNSLTWTASPGATGYAVYRTTTTQSGIGGTGYLETVTTNSYDDDGTVTPAGDPYTTSAYTYTSLVSLLASMVKVAYTQAYDETDVEFPNNAEQEFQFNNSTGGTTQYLDDIYIQTADDSAAGNPYFDSADDAYLASSYDPLQLLGLLCRNLGLIARYTYDVTSSAHRIQLITRGSTYVTAVTMDGGVADSIIENGFDLSFQGVRVGVTLEKTYAGQNCTLGTSGGLVQITATAHGFSNGDIVEIQGARPESLNRAWTASNSAANTFTLAGSTNYSYLVSAGVVVLPATFYEIPNDRGGVGFSVNCLFTCGMDNDGGIYDTGQWDVMHFRTMEGAGDNFFAPSVIFWHKYSTGTDPSETTVPEWPRALAQYYEDRFDSYGKVYGRTFGAITATLSGTSSHLNVTPYHKVSVNDGTGAANHLIVETRYNLNRNQVYLQLVEET